jgi:hypothetical protein
MKIVSTLRHINSVDDEMGKISKYEESVKCLSVKGGNPVVVRRNKGHPPTISNQLAYTRLRPSVMTSRTPNAVEIGN